MNTLIHDIKREIDGILTEHVPDPHNPENGGACLYIAHAAATVLHKTGLRPVIQAGSLQWPIMARDEDDGQCQTHFSYMWEPHHPASISASAAGTLPEMHVWCGLIQPQTLIDFSTGDLKRHAETCGLTWRSGDPPEYLWATADTMPDWVVYTPNRAASIYACGILDRLFQPDYLR